jgi:16S rRNA (cytidine1402-2'-O)-methyltransferase
MTGRILLAATPIGNVRDASSRLVEALATSGVIAAEDTRRVRDLARRLGVTISGSVVALHDHNERDRAPELVRRATEGTTVLLVTDAGMPTVSDPGYRVVEAAVAAGVAVTVLPGPSAVLTALALSGLPSDRFCFEGFPPRGGGERSAFFDALASERRTMIFFEAPHRLDSSLVGMVAAFGEERRAAVARELTKTHEEVRRGGLAELVAWAESSEVLGEIVVVVEGAPANAPDLETLAREALDRADGGERLKEAVADIASLTGVRSRDLYAAALAARRTSASGSPASPTDRRR